MIKTVVTIEFFYDDGDDDVITVRKVDTWEGEDEDCVDYPYSLAANLGRAACFVINTGLFGPCQMEHQSGISYNYEESMKEAFASAISDDLRYKGGKPCRWPPNKSGQE